jgi:hypothetical protein
MVELAVWLCVVGLCDLVRAARDATSALRRGLIAALGAALFLFAAVALDGPWPATGLVLLGWVGCFGLWLLGSSASLSEGAADRWRPVARLAAFGGLTAGVVVGLLAGGALETEPSRLAGPLGAVPGDVLLLVAGVGLLQLSTANIAVRLLLDAVGVPASANEKKLKGGRMLGPMERLFIVGLGLAGQLTAAAVVVAAKGLLRFPELQRGSAEGGPSDVTEYFLIGSFASWLLALAGLGLLALGIALR